MVENNEISIENLVQSGVHFGHQSRRWHPKMKPYIYGEKNKVHIINIRKTQSALQKVVQLIEEEAAKGKTFLVCATKKQAQDIVKETCERSGLFYINHRWLGGMLTNFATVQSSINQLKKIEQKSVDGTYDKLTKKEISSLERKKEKLLTYFAGIKKMTTLPDYLIVIDAGRENIAVKEANRLGIPVIAVVDTNTNPENIDYVIPGNDDSLKAISLYLDLFARAFAEGQKRRPQQLETADSKPQTDDTELEDALEDVAPLNDHDLD